MNTGLCKCGCGRPTRVANRNYSWLGVEKGDHFAYVRGHRPGVIRPSVDGRRLSDDGYVLITIPGHPHADEHGTVREHIAIAVKVLGKPLPQGAAVHHVNEIKTDNRNENFVICQDNSYHKLLHSRTRALRACGNPNFRKCHECGEWDDPRNMVAVHGAHRHRSHKVKACA